MRRPPDYRPSNRALISDVWPLDNNQAIGRYAILRAQYGV